MKRWENTVSNKERRKENVKMKKKGSQAKFQIERKKDEREKKRKKKERKEGMRRKNGRTKGGKTNINDLDLPQCLMLNWHDVI